MDYEKKYEDALYWMRKIYPTLTGVDKEDAEHYFPELKESEDERIRKGLVKMISDIDGGHPFENYGIIKKEALAYLEKQKEQKPKQSEEEHLFVRSLQSLIVDFVRRSNGINSEYYQRVYDWLEGRHVEPEKQEWSEEDEGLIDLAVAAVEEFYDKSNPIRVEIINFLKSLCPQPHWKPSKEQMDALDAVYKTHYMSPTDKSTILNLINDLKSL